MCQLLLSGGIAAPIGGRAVGFRHTHETVGATELLNGRALIVDGGVASDPRWLTDQRGKGTAGHLVPEEVDGVVDAARQNATRSMTHANVHQRV